MLHLHCFASKKYSNSTHVNQLKAAGVPGPGPLYCAGRLSGMVTGKCNDTELLLMLLDAHGQVFTVTMTL